MDVNSELITAAAYGDLAEVQRAIDDGADVNYNLDLSHDSELDHVGGTALMLASRGYFWNKPCNGIEIVKLLLEHGWDPNAQDKNGHTPLDVAHARHDELLSHLLEDRGALAAHHRKNMEKFRKHKEEHARIRLDHHERFVHQHMHEHNEHGAPDHNHWRKNAKKMDL